MGPDQHMGPMYPFTLSQKLEHITEASSWYAGDDTPWSRPIVPLEMVSVLFQHGIADIVFGERGSAVGLFADQEIRLADGPVFVDEDYDIGREVVAFSGSRRTDCLPQPAARCGYPAPVELAGDSAKAHALGGHATDRVAHRAGEPVRTASVVAAARSRARVGWGLRVAWGLSQAIKSTRASMRLAMNAMLRLSVAARNDARAKLQ